MLLRVGDLTHLVDPSRDVVCNEETVIEILERHNDVICAFVGSPSESTEIVRVNSPQKVQLGSEKKKEKERRGFFSCFRRRRSKQREEESVIVAESIRQAARDRLFMRNLEELHTYLFMVVFSDDGGMAKEKDKTTPALMRMVTGTSEIDVYDLFEMGDAKHAHHPHALVVSCEMKDRFVRERIARAQQSYEQIMDTHLPFKFDDTLFRRDFCMDRSSILHDIYVLKGDAFPLLTQEQVSRLDAFYREAPSDKKEKTSNHTSVLVSSVGSQESKDVDKMIFDALGKLVIRAVRPHLKICLSGDVGYRLKRTHGPASRLRTEAVSNPGSKPSACDFNVIMQLNDCEGGEILFPKHRRAVNLNAGDVLFFPCRTHPFYALEPRCAVSSFTLETCCN